MYKKRPLKEERFVRVLCRRIDEGGGHSKMEGREGEGM